MKTIIRLLVFIFFLSACKIGKDCKDSNYYFVNKEKNNKDVNIKGKYCVEVNATSPIIDKDSCVVSGYVYDRYAGEVLKKAAVNFVGSQNYGVATDDKGYFEMKLPKGMYHVEIYYLGKMPLITKEFEFKGTFLIKLNYYLGTKIQ